MQDRKKSRVLLLIGNKLWNWNTVNTFKKSTLNIVGVCVYNNNFFGFPIKYLFKSIKKRGIIAVIDQILGRLLYKIINLYSDRRRLNEIFNLEDCKYIKKNLEIPSYFTHSYNDKKTIEWISKLNPNVVVVHTEGWVGKEIRSISQIELIIGGHPGLTPTYRGSHSPFWAIYNKEEKKVGYSIFHIDGGVDTGDLIFQKEINISNKKDSYISLGWKGMKEIARKQVEIIEEYEKTQKISRTKHHNISDASEYPIPGLSHYVRYLYIQNKVK